MIEYPSHTFKVKQSQNVVLHNIFAFFFGFILSKFYLNGQDCCKVNVTVTQTQGQGQCQGHT